MKTSSKQKIVTAKRRRPAETRKKLLESAAQILESEGLEQLNTNALAQAAGVAVPTVYRNFRNKEDVLIALARDFIGAEQAWLQAAEKGFYASTNLEEAVSLLIDLYWTSAKSYTGIVPLRAAMRVWPALREVEEESLTNSGQWLAHALGDRYPALNRAQARKTARYVVETVCSTIDRCYTLGTAERRWRMDALKAMLTHYLVSIPGISQLD